MPEQAEVVIVDRAGTEHVFPPGFDPKKAAGIVKERTEGRWEDRGLAGARWHPPEGSGQERNRPDNSILGLPPELAVTSALGVGSAIVKGGATLASKGYAGIKAVAGQSAPAIKYEAVKGGLEWVGVPSSVAVPVAIAASGYRTKKTATPRTTIPKTPSAASAASPPVASPPATPVSPAASGAPTAAPISSAGPGWSPQRIQNEVGLAARRTKATLTKEQYAEAEHLVRSGTAPIEAVRAVSSGKAAAAPVAAPSKPKLSAAETKEYVRLRSAGKTDQQAIESIAQQRALIQQLGTPSSDVVRQRVTERNATGRWSK